MKSAKGDVDGVDVGLLGIEGEIDGVEVGDALLLLLLLGFDDGLLVTVGFMVGLDEGEELGLYLVEGDVEEVGSLAIEGEGVDSSVGCNDGVIEVVLDVGLIDGEAVGGLVIVAVGSKVSLMLAFEVSVDETSVVTVNATSSLSSNGPRPQLPSLLVDPTTSFSICRMLTRTACSDPLGSV